jgi:hypothetical protein
MENSKVVDYLLIPSEEGTADLILSPQTRTERDDWRNLRKKLGEIHNEKADAIRNDLRTAQNLFQQYGVKATSTTRDALYRIDAVTNATRSVYRDWMQLAAEKDVKIHHSSVFFAALIAATIGSCHNEIFTKTKWLCDYAFLQKMLQQSNLPGLYVVLGQLLVDAKTHRTDDIGVKLPADSADTKYGKIDMLPSQHFLVQDYTQLDILWNALELGLREKIPWSWIDTKVGKKSGYVRPDDDKFPRDLTARTGKLPYGTSAAQNPISLESYYGTYVCADDAFYVTEARNNYAGNQALHACRPSVSTL